MNTSTFDIRNFLDQLQSAKQKNKYYCPVCRGNDLEIELETGKYSCFHGCDRRDIREALKPWAEVLEERRQQNPGKKVSSGAPKKSYTPPKEPVPLPQGKLAVARLSEIPTDIPQPTKATVVKKTREALESKGCTAEEIKQTTVVTYEYGDGKAFHRFQAPCSKNLKGYDKTFAVSHVNEKGETVWKKGKDTWKAYRQDEAIAAALAIENGSVPVILAHEGEQCVEVGRTEKLAGINAQGTPSENDWICILNQIKMGMGDRSFVLAYCPDNDDAGIQKAKTLVAAAARSLVPLVVINLKAIIPNLCEKGDIADILRNDNMTGDELAQLLREEIYQIESELNNLEKKDLEVEEDGYDPQNPESFYRPVCEKMGLPLENCVTATAFDTWTYHKEFSAAQDWRVIDSAFYKWSSDQQYWQHQPDSRINTLIADAGEKAFKLSYSNKFGWRVNKPYGTNSHKESAFKYVRSRLERPEPLPTNTHLLGLKNCVVDLRTGHMMPHSKEYFLTNIIPYDYEPGKPCPEVFRQFVVESFGEDMLEVIRAFTSMFLDPTAPYGRFPHLIGQSGGGKGTLGRFWSSLFGEEGSGNAALFSDISTPEGRHQYLTGKRIFGFPDVGGYAEGVRAFYELVDNGSMSGRALFNPVAYSKQWYIRFWLASVDHLQIENAGDGWIRRAYPIPVKSRIVKPDSDLRMKLEACKADVISWALAMPRAERDRILLSPPESERAVNLALDAALYGDSTKSFVDLCLRPSQETGFIPHHQLHTWYVAYCKEHGYTPLGMSKFVSHLKTILYRNFQDRTWSPMVNGKRERIPAHWKYLAPLPGIFVSWEQNTRDSGENPLPPSNPIWCCIKSRCEEGGLMDFEVSWQPKSPEPSPGMGGQGALDSKNEGGQAETTQNQGCPPCPLVQGVDPDIKISDRAIAFESIRNLTFSQPQSEGGQNRTPWTPAPELDSSLSTHPVDTRNRGGHPVQAHQDWIPASLHSPEELKPLAFTFKAGDRIKCYPTQRHADNKWKVSATVTEIESQNGWFGGCAITYTDKKKGVVSGRISGGCCDWILAKS